jgi:hypothetical protein
MQGQYRHREQIQERILREADFEGQVAAANAAVVIPSATELREGIEESFEEEQEQEWRDPIKEVAERLTP